MAITFISSTEFSYSSGDGVISDTRSINIGTRTKGALCVFVNLVNGVGGGGDPTGVTWNGTALTKPVETGTLPWSSDAYYILDPADGTHDLVTTFTGTGITNGALGYHIIVFWIDSDNDLELTDINTVAAGTTDPTSIDLVAGASGAFCASSYITADNNVATSGETLIQDWDQGGNCSGASYLIATGSGTQTLDWDRSASGLASPFNISGFVLEEQTTGSPPTIALNTANDEVFIDDTPTLEFTGSDVNDDDLEYEIKITDNLDSYTAGDIIKESLTSGSGVVIHPNPVASGLTWEGKIPVDDRLGQVFRGCGGRLKQIEINFGPHETTPEDTDGQYVCRVYLADGYPVGTVLSAWAATTGYSINNEIRPTSTANADVHFVYRCTTGGTSGGSEPTWPLVPGNTVNDNGVIWETIKAAGPINPAAPEDTPTPNWIAQSTIYDYNPGAADSGWKVLAFTGDQQIRLERDVLYCFILDWWPADRVTNNALAIQNASLTAATYGYGNVYLDATIENNNGPRVTEDTLFKITETYILLDKLSDTHAGFVNTVNGGDGHPFNAGEKVAFTVQAGDALFDGEFNWQARVSDPGGTGGWSDWATTRSFTVSTGEGLYPSGIASGEAFGTPTFVPGAVTISPTGIASAGAIGVPTVQNVSGGTQYLTPTGIATGAAFGSPSFVPGMVTISPSGFIDPGGYGAPNVSLASGTQYLTPTGIASGAAFGTPSVGGENSVSPVGIASAQAFGTPSFSYGAVTITPTGIISSEAFGTVIASAEGQTQYLYLTHPIDSEENWETPAIYNTQSHTPPGIGSQEALGIPLVWVVGNEPVQKIYRAATSWANASRGVSAETTLFREAEAVIIVYREGKENAVIQIEETIFKNEARDIQYTVVDEDGAVFNLTGFTVTWKAALKGSSTSVISKTTPTGVTLDTPASGICTVHLLTGDTNLTPGSYDYECRAINTPVNVVVAYGRLVIKNAIS